MNTIKEAKMAKGGRNDPPTTSRPPKPKGQQPKVKYPECEKMQKVSLQSNVVGEFLDWLSNKKNLTLMKYIEEDENTMGGYHPYRYQTEQLLAEFFDIDLVKVEQERRQMLEDLK